MGAQLVLTLSRYCCCMSLLIRSTTGTDVQGMIPTSVITMAMRSGDVTS